MLFELDETIKAVLRERGGLPAAEVDIAFDAPDREWSGRVNRPTVNCYLYDIRENLQLREAGWSVKRDLNGRQATKAIPPRLFDMSYVCTAWTNDVEDEHRLLWRVLETFLRVPLLPEAQLQGDLRELNLPLITQVAQPNALLRNPAEVWSALENRIRPSVNLVVTMPLSDFDPVLAPLVFTKVVAIQERGEREEQVTIGGVVRDEDGNLLPHVTVSVEDHAYAAQTDASGRFRLPGMPPDTYTLVAEDDGRRGTRTVEVPGADYDVQLSRKSRGRRERAGAGGSD